MACVSTNIIDENLDPNVGFTGAINNLNSDARNDDFIICMSVVEDGPRIAFASYNEKLKIITLEQCIADGYETQELAERVLANIRPTLLLLSNKIVSNEALLDVLTTPQTTLIEDSNENNNKEVETFENFENQSISHQQNTIISGKKSSTTIPYRLMKTSSFDIRSCRGIILKLRVASIMNRRRGNCYRDGNTDLNRTFPLALPSNNSEHYNVSSYHALASVVDFDSTVQVQALGSLLTFLQSTIFRLEEGGFISVDDVVYSKSSRYMYIPTDTLSSLHIFATEHHPIAAAKGHGNSKEGFSLFSLLDRTKSRAGRQRLREWMLKPLCDVDEIARRQDGVELFSVLPDMHNPAGAIVSFLERVGSVDQILVRIQKCSAKPSDFLLLSKALSSAVAIITTLQDEILSRLRQRLETCGEANHNHSREPQIQNYIEFTISILSRCHVTSLRNLFQRVTSIIDEEATFECKSIVIRRGHHEQLDLYKQQFACLKETLQYIGLTLAQRIPHLRNFMEVIFIPQVGFLVALQNQVRWIEEGTLPEDFVYVFTEGEKSFFKSSDVRDLDENIGDLDAYIKDTEAFIVSELEEEILDVEKEIRASFSALADLDCILAFADCAIDLKYIRPEVVHSDQNCIEIVKGRHPLQEIIMENSYRANDTNMNTSERVTIITGPNFSGKSCYARQVGVLVFMAHIGCFIPCEDARISIIDQMIARFSSPETCSVPQSSLQLDLTQLGQTLRRESPKSLVIIDEFGKGTSPASGIALLTAVIRKLAKIQCKVICTTHFLEIFSMGLLKDGDNGIKTMRMAVHISETPDKESSPLFTLEHGVASSSAGLVCAKIAGVKEAVIERAHELIDALKERRKVQPLVEILRSNLALTSSTKQILDIFVNTEWAKSSDEEVDQLLSTIHSE